LSIKEIAKAKNVSPASVYSWKIAHKDEIKNAGIEPKTAKNDTKIAENVQKVNDSANKLFIHELSAKVKEQESAIAKLRVSLAERDRQVDALLVDKKKLLEYQQNIEGTDETVARTERYAKKIAELEKEKAELFQRNQNQAGTIEVLKNNLDAAIATTGAKDNLIAEMNATAADWDDGIDQLQKEKANLLKSTQNQASTIDALQKNLDSANTLYQEKCKLIDDINAAVNDLESEKRDLENGNSILKYRLKAIRDQRDTYEKRSNQFESQLHALEAYVLTLLEPAK
jgi:chromosome segregation ATPase